MFWLEVLGWAGSALLVVSILQSDIFRLRVLNLVASVALVAYNLALAVWPGVGLNLVVGLINVVYITRILREKRRTSGAAGES
jgi:hypothetical protein